MATATAVKTEEKPLEQYVIPLDGGANLHVVAEKGNQPPLGMYISSDAPKQVIELLRYANASVEEVPADKAPAGLPGNLIRFRLPNPALLPPQAHKVDAIRRIRTLLENISKRIEPIAGRMAWDGENYKGDIGNGSYVKSAKALVFNPPRKYNEAEDSGESRVTPMSQAVAAAEKIYENLSKSQSASSPGAIKESRLQSKSFLPL